MEGGINRGWEWGQSQGVFLKVGDFLPGFSGMPRSSPARQGEEGYSGNGEKSRC